MTSPYVTSGEGKSLDKQLAGFARTGAKPRFPVSAALRPPFRRIPRSGRRGDRASRIVYAAHLGAGFHVGLAESAGIGQQRVGPV